MSPHSVSVNGEGENPKVRLEQEYMALLEQRIAQLQQQVNATSDVKEPAASSEASAVGGSIDESAKDSTKKPSLVKTSAADGEVAQPCDGDAQTTPTSPKLKGTVRHVISKYNADTGGREETPIEEAEAKEVIAEAETYLRNVMDITDSRKLAFNQIDLGQGALRNLIKDVLIDYPHVQSWTSPRINVNFDYLVYEWDQLEAAVEEKVEDSPEIKQARKDLAKVLDYVRNSKQLEAYFRTRKANLEQNAVEFAYLWTIFRPGDDVISNTFMEERHILRVVSANEGSKASDIRCWYYDHDGNKHIPCEVDFKVEKFENARPIDSLPVYPLHYYKALEDQEALKKELIDRGRNFERYSMAPLGVQQMFDYKGKVMVDTGRTISRHESTRNTQDDDLNSGNTSSPRSLRSSSSFKKQSADGVIIIDPDMYIERSSELYLADLEVEIQDTEDDLYEISADEKYLISPPRVLGWWSRGKSWCQFAISGVSEAKPVNEKVFEEELQLDHNMKKMIKALVRNHSNKDITNADLIEGKGRSLVLLLHGPPGVGKTLTAEAIAAESRRPLLTVSVAEIGLNASKAEESLERIFHLASRWEAILLVDEADVFLESRVREADSNRNALVSILLRALEYYHGIMILTTNRIKSIDVAVQSRIHLAVRYEDLSQDQMRAILKTILKKFKVQGKDQDIILRSFGEYADDMNLNLNGRQIRNLVSSAQAVATAEGMDSITWDHIKQVTKVTRDFQNQLQKHVADERYDREAPKVQRS